MEVQAVWARDMIASELSQLVAVLGMLGLIYVGLANSIRLEWKVKAPYTLKKATSQQKWRWAVELGFFRMLMWLLFPAIILGSEDTLVGTLRALPVMLALAALGLALTILLARRELDLALECYTEWERWVKSGGRYRSESLRSLYDYSLLTLIARWRKLKPYKLPPYLQWRARCWKAPFYRQLMGPTLGDDKERRRFWLAGYPPERDP